MKTKLKVKEIEDKNINVPVNSGEQHIAEIKEEIQTCFSCPNGDICKSEVLEMWENP